MAWYDKFYDSNGYEIGGVQLPACSWFGPTPRSEMRMYIENAKRMEESGELMDLFKCACINHFEYPTKEKTLKLIQPEMRLFKSFFKRIYGYEISYPGFADQALSALEEAGCSKARAYYQQFVDEYEKKHDEKMKNVAAWYRGQIEKGDEQSRKRQREVEQRKADLHKKSDSELLTLLQKLKSENVL